jgi:hypothetical protein
VWRAVVGDAVECVINVSELAEPVEELEVFGIAFDARGGGLHCEQVAGRGDTDTDPRVSNSVVAFGSAPSRKLLTVSSLEHW